MANSLHVYNVTTLQQNQFSKYFQPVDLSIIENYEGDGKIRPQNAEKISIEVYLFNFEWRIFLSTSFQIESKNYRCSTTPNET